MKQLKPALITYLVSGSIYVFSAMMGYEYAVFVSKPVIASSMMFHYWNESKGKVNFWYLIVLLLYFFSGILNLFDDSITLQFVMTLNLFAYSILLFLMLKVVIRINFKLVDDINIVYLFFTLIFLASMVYLALFLVFDEDFQLYSYMVIYTFILTLLAVFTTIVYSMKPFNGIAYLMIATYCYIICDLFYIIYYYTFDFLFFRLLSILSSVMSYYFLVNYFVLTSNKINQISFKNEIN